MAKKFEFQIDPDVPETAKIKNIGTDESTPIGQFSFVLNQEFYTEMAQHPDTPPGGGEEGPK